MSEEIFRKKSLDRMKAPESLNEYIRVANPGVWLVLAGAIALLVGLGIWGIFGNIESGIDVTATVDNGTAVCELSQEEAECVSIGMPLQIGEADGVIQSVDAASGIAAAETEAEDGVYSAKIITESIHPFSFIFN